MQRHPPLRPWPRYKAALLGAGLCLLALVMAHHVMLVSGFEQVQGTRIDSRLLHYILEYSYMAAFDPRLEILSLPYFYPVPGVAAYTDLMLSVAPLYWPLRALGFDPYAAFQLWLITMTALTFAAAHALLLIGFRLSPPAAGVGAVMIAACGSRVGQMGHPQLLAPFFSLASLLALLLIFRAPGQRPATASVLRASRWRRVGLFLLFFLGGVGQLYTSFYIGYFYLLSLCLSLALALCLPRPRRAIFALLRRDGPMLAGAFLFAAAALLPLLSLYLGAAAKLDPRPMWQITSYTPRLGSWFFMGPESMLYGWTAAMEPFISLPTIEEQGIGFGLVTSAAAALGLWFGRSTAVRLVGLTGLALVLVFTVLPGGISIWWGLLEWLPGARALRVIPRISLLVSVPVALGLASSVHVLLGRARREGRMRWAALAMCLATLCLAEQLRRQPAYEKEQVKRTVTSIAVGLDRRASAFYYTPLVARRRPASMLQEEVHLDAMWAGLQAGVPTINGYNGQVPPRYPLRRAILSGLKQSLGQHDRLAQWCKDHGLERASVQWLLMPRLVEGPR